MEEEVAEYHQHDRKDVDHANTRLDEHHPVKAGQDACHHREEPNRKQLSGEQVHQGHEGCAKKSAHHPPAEGIKTEDLDPDGDDQLGEGRLRVEIVLTLEVRLGIVREIGLVENKGRVRRNRVRQADPLHLGILVRVSDSPGADGSAAQRPAQQIGEHRAGETQESRYQGQRQQPEQVGAVDAPPGTPSHSHPLNRAAGLSSLR